MKSGIFLILLLVILSISYASATISLSEINNFYNIGDRINLKVDISRADSFQGFLKVYFVCNNTESSIYYSSIMLEPNKQETSLIDFPVATTGNSCYFKAVLENSNNAVIEEMRTAAATLSNNIEISATLNKEEFLPEEEIKIEGQAVKKNGEVFDGNIKINFNNNEYQTETSKGKFSYKIKLEKNIKPGNYIIKIYADKNDNMGSISKNIKIKAVPTALLILTNGENFLPENLLLITPVLADQANGTMPAAISVIFTKEPDGFILSIFSKKQKFIEALIESGNQTLYKFDKYAEPGKYIIKIETGEFKAEKTIRIEVVEKIESRHDNNLLYITNVGNVPFRKPVEVEFKIENHSEKRLLYPNLKVNETESYKLNAPKGTYEILVNTGAQKMNFSSVPLTGNFIMTLESDKAKQQTNIIYISLIVISLLLVFILFHPKIKERQEIKHYKRSGGKLKSTLIIPEVMHEIVSAEPKKKTANENISHIHSYQHGDIFKRTFSKHAEKLAAYNLMACPVYGTKQEITALSVSFHGIDKLINASEKDNSLFKETISKYFAIVVDKIKDYQGVADISGNNILILFNVVKQFRHDIAAIKTAQDIKKATEKFNEDVKHLGISIKIKAGINTGNAIVSNITDKTVKYTSIGNTVMLAKALEKKAFENEILITQNVYERAGNAVSADKVTPLHLTEKDAIGVYNLSDASQSNMKEKYKEYVDRVLKRI